MRTKTPQQAEKMLEAAARLFGTQLFHQVRMEDIASEAGVGKGTLYRYFSDKDELHVALLSRASDQFRERTRKAIDEAPDSRRKLTAFVRECLAFFDEKPHMGPLIQRAEVTRGQESPWAKTRNNVGEWLNELFAEAEKKQEFKIQEPEISTFLLLGGLRNIVLFTPPPRPDGLADRIVGAFLDKTVA